MNNLYTTTNFIILKTTLNYIYDMTIGPLKISY